MSDQKKPDKLIIAVVQSQDGELVERTLEEANYSFGKLPSVGGFFARKK